MVHTHTTDGLTDAAACKLFTPGFKLVHTFHFGNYPHRRNSDLWLERVGRGSRIGSARWAKFNGASFDPSIVFGR